MCIKVHSLLIVRHLVVVVSTAASAFIALECYFSCTTAQISTRDSLSETGSNLDTNCKQ